jgi:hypothetical protein
VPETPEWDALRIGQQPDPVRVSRGVAVQVHVSEPGYAAWLFVCVNVGGFFLVKGTRHVRFSRTGPFFAIPTKGMIQRGVLHG